VSSLGIACRNNARENDSRAPEMVRRPMIPGTREGMINRLSASSKRVGKGCGRCETLAWLG